MSQSKDSFEFILKHSIKYTHKGSDPLDGQLIMCYGPSGKVFKTFARVQQMYEQASRAVATAALEKISPDSVESIRNAVQDMKNQNKKESDDNFTESDADSFFQMIISSDIDIEFFFDRFQALMCGVCMVEDKEPLTATMWDAMNFRDKNRLVGWYIGNFMESSD